jgi:hypothetical protein
MASSGQVPWKALLSRLQKAAEHAHAEFEQAKTTDSLDRRVAAVHELERALRALTEALFGRDSV